jgi:hypothetical protein
MIKVTVTLDHIRAAKPMPYSSPVALALKESGIIDPSVTVNFIYIGADVFDLPPIAKEHENEFYDLVKSGESIQDLKGYDFELGAKINVA